MQSGGVQVEDRKFQISSTKLLLVEGVDDQAVFNALCQKMGVTGIQVLRYNGKTNFRNFVEDLTSLDGFDEVESMGVTTDVDDDPLPARDRIRGALENASLPVPDEPLTFAEGLGLLKVVYLLIPHQNETGELEDVCLNAVADEAAMHCVEDFMGCIEERVDRVVEPSKSRLQAFLSTRRDPDVRIGEAIMAGYLPYDADAFAPLRTLIRML